MALVWTTRISQPSKAAASINMSRSNSYEELVPPAVPGSSHHSRHSSLEEVFRTSVARVAAPKSSSVKNIELPLHAESDATASGKGFHIGGDGITTAASPSIDAESISVRGVAEENASRPSDISTGDGRVSTRPQLAADEKARSEVHHADAPEQQATIIEPSALNGHPAKEAHEHLSSSVRPAEPAELMKGSSPSGSLVYFDLSQPSSQVTLS